MANQLATSVNYQNSSTKDDLLVTYGKIQGSIVAQFISQKYKNTNYTDTPTRGGTVKVKRFNMSTSQAYGTARAAAAANKLTNNGVDVKIDTDKEIAEEMSAKDRKLYMEGADTFLQSREADYALSRGVTLETAYFVQLQTEATTFDTSPYTDSDPVKQIILKIEALIRKLEVVNNNNVKGVDRSSMLLTLAPEFFDALEKHVQTLPNPFNGGVDAKFFRRVLVEPAVRQGVDAVVQVMGSVAQPVVMGNFKVAEAEFSADEYAYLPYFFGTKAVMPDLIFKAALSSDNNISV